MDESTGRVQVSICPLIVTRFAGLAAATLAFDDSDYRAVISKSRGLREAVCRERKLLAESLGSVIAGTQGRQKMQLIQARRDIFNCRTRRAQISLEHHVVTLHDLCQRLDFLILLEKQLVEAESMVADLTPATVTRRLLCLSALFISSAAAKGLALSSPQFVERLHKISGDLITSRGLTQTSSTLLRYVARSATKTSPFSFFCPVGFGEIVETLESIRMDEAASTSRAVFNTQVLASMATSDTFQSETLTWNKSLLHCGERLIWILQKGWIDVIRSVSVSGCNPLTSILLQAEACMTQGTATPSLQLLDDGSLEALKRAGLLLRQVKSAGAITSMVGAYSDQTTASRGGSYNLVNLNRFRSGSLSERLTVIREFVAEGCRTTDGIEQNPLRIIREDVIADSPTQILSSTLKGPLYDLSDMSTRLAALSGPLEYQMRISYCLNDWFPGRKGVPILEFAERLFREIQPAETSSPVRLQTLLRKFGGTQWANSGGSELKDQLREEFHARKTCYGQKEIALNLSRVGSARLVTGGLSSGYFQFCRPDERQLAVANGFGTGCGCGARRYFNYNTEFYVKYRNWLQNVISDGAVDVVILDDVLFHGDVAPRLFDYYFDIPGLKVMDPALSGFDLRNCIVVAEPSRPAELSCVRSGRRIYAHYDSLLTALRRPFLTQLLMLFCRPGWGFNHHSINRLFRNFQDASPRPIGAAGRHYPRVVINNRTVVHRESWVFSKENIPVLGGKTLAATVAAVRSWLEENDIPPLVYAKSLKASEARNGGGKAEDDYKPQFIDFSDPAWCLFFVRYISRITGDIELQEALPNPFAVDRVEEHYIQWAFDNVV